MSKDLSNHNFKTLYSSPQEITDFYKESLTDAKLYKRITAYISNDVFKHLKKGLPEFIKNDGYFQLILSKEISADTIDEIEFGYTLKEDCKYILLSNREIVAELEKICYSEEIGLFSFLIAIGKLDVKISFKKIGIVHDKFGLITDGYHNLAYMGSNNFTNNAMSYNDEAFQVTIDWDNPSNRELEFISKLDELFDSYWNNQKEDVITVELPDPIITKMINSIDYDYIKKYQKITDFIRMDINIDGLLTIFTNMDEKKIFTYKNFKIFNKFIVSIDNIHVLQNITKSPEIFEFCNVVKKLCKELEIGYYETYRLNKYLDLHVRDYPSLKKLGNSIKSNDYLSSEDFIRIKTKLNNLVKRPLVDKQLVAAAHIINMEKSLNFSAPGSGKTATVLGAFEYLSNLPRCNRKHVDKLLVIGPVNCAKSWRDEYDIVSTETKNHKPLNIIGSGDRYDKAQILRHDYPSSRLIIINYESVVMLKDELLDLINEKTMIVFDEVHRIKNITSEKYKILYEVSKNSRFRVALTGTPLPNGYIDLFNIISLLHDDYTSTYFGMYHSELNYDDRMFKTTGVQNDSLNKLVNPFYIRVNKKDLNVPLANPDHIISVKVNDNEKSIYNKIYKDYENTFSRINKLQEVSLIPFKCFDIDDLGKSMINYFDENNIEQFYTSKIIAFLRELKKRNRKCVVWCLFVDSINLITTILKHEGYKAKGIYGEVEQEERDRIIDKFNFSNEVEIIVTNPATLAESVSLHRACHDAHYLEYNYNLYQYLQSRDRIHRLGLKEKQETNYYLYVNQYTDNIEDSADYRILQSLKIKEKRMLNSIDNGYFLFDNGDIEFDKI
ncbi:MAG: SNF2-related protein [Bacilli bacterium]